MTSERRQAIRVSYRGGVLPPTAEVLPGRPIVVVNLSATGMLFETAWHVRPGRLIEVRLYFAASALVVRADVLRAYVSALDGRRGIRYRAAIAFATRITVPQPGDLLDEYRKGAHERPPVERPGRSPVAPRAAVGRA